MGLLPLDMDILPPSDDRVFKLILTAPEAKPVLIDLISAIINKPVTDVFVRNNELPKNDAEEKSERLDVNCRLGDGTQVDLEMQASHISEDSGGDHRNLKGKGVYYLCDLHSSQESKGKRYDKLAMTYQVTFCSYTVFSENNRFLNSFSLRNDISNEQLTDAIQVVYVELSKLKETMGKSVKDMTDIEKWAVFFRYAGDPESRVAVNNVIESKEAIQMAGELLMGISKDERERAVYRSRRMYQTDLDSNLATERDNGIKIGIEIGEKRGEKRGIEIGEKRGIEIGEKRGIEIGEKRGMEIGEKRGMEIGEKRGMEIGYMKTKLEVAEKMLAINIPYEQVVVTTGLPVDTVKKLMHKLLDQKDKGGDTNGGRAFNGNK